MRGYGSPSVQRTAPVAHEDERGPDSLECLSAKTDGAYQHSECVLDYTALGEPRVIVVGTFVTAIGGFICGCSCHDHPSLETS